MKRVYAPTIDGLAVIPPLYPNLGFRGSGNMLHFDKVFAGWTEKFVECVDRPEDADLLLVPHPFAAARTHAEYMRMMIGHAQRLGKKLVVVLYGDSDEIIDLPSTVVLRTSQYSYRMHPRDVMMPAYAEDLLGEQPFIPRQKQDIPTIGFCGWSKPKNVKNRVGTALKNGLVQLRATVDRRILAETKGITLRSRALTALRTTPGITCSFIERSSYSGHKDTIALDPTKAREEFIANMRESDFILCAKGDGNFSYRFFETLGMGRIPLLLDTACVLPLQDRIDYDTFVCRVPLEDLPHIGDRARAWYAARSPDEYAAAQRAARNAFTSLLRPERYFRTLFNEVL